MHIQCHDGSPSAQYANQHANYASPDSAIKMRFDGRTLPGISVLPVVECRLEFAQQAVTARQVKGAYKQCGIAWTRQFQEIIRAPAGDFSKSDGCSTRKLQTIRHYLDPVVRRKSLERNEWWNH